jgi:nucleotide-binding universal stress UspA family protein
MMSSSGDHETLRKILLATDMSARCDRALDRAVAIAADTGANLLILHVFEEFDEASLSYGRYEVPSWRAPPDAAEMAKRRIRSDLHADVGDTVEKATVLIREGEPADVIQRVVELEGVDLIVTGIARERLFASRPVILGRTVEKLLRRMPVPILIVHNRPRASYRHILVTTDFSESSAYALQMALSFFPDRTLHLLHAFQVPQSGITTGVERQTESFRRTHEMELDEFLASLVLPEEARQRLVKLVEIGLPAHLVRDYVHDRGADLVVMGTRGRGPLVEALIGSTAKSILQLLPCDALVVSGPPRRVPRDR